MNLLAYILHNFLNSVPLISKFLNSNGFNGFSTFLIQFQIGGCKESLKPLDFWNVNHIFEISDYDLL